MIDFTDKRQRVMSFDDISPEFLKRADDYAKQEAAHEGGHTDMFMKCLVHDACLYGYIDQHDPREIGEVVGEGVTKMLRDAEAT
jgi:hypothetical protein